MNPITDGWEEEKPAKKKRESKLDFLRPLLLEAGYLAPRNESEVEVFERAMTRRKDTPPLPAELNDPDAIIARAKTWKQTNVMTRAQWEAHLKKTAE